MMRRVLLIALLAVAGCTSQSDLAYRPEVIQPNMVAPAPVIASVSVIDQRPQDPRRLATIMSVIGMPSSILHTKMDVKDEVGSVFDQALLARQLTRNDGNGPLSIQLVVRRFDSDMIWGGQANIDMTMTVLDRASGRPIYSDAFQQQIHDNSRIATNIVFGPHGTDVTVLLDMCNQVLNNATDTLLERDGFKQVVLAAARRPAP